VTRVRFAACVAAVLACTTGKDALAHKPITSKYTFTEDVEPIVTARCGACHRPGGIGPMSLLTYDEARPWAESMRAELTAAHMPPWFAEIGVSEIKDVHRLSPREIDVLLTWITGGTPRGPADVPPVAPPAKVEWPAGKPDLVRPLPTDFTLPAASTEETREFVVQPASDHDQFVTAVDLKPGNAAIVHDAMIYTAPAGSTDPSAWTVLAAWVPGVSPAMAPAGTAFQWRAGESLVARIHYRKTWTYEGKALTDRSSVGVYFAKGAPRRLIRAAAVASSEVVLDEETQVLAFRTLNGSSEAAGRVEAHLPDGTKASLIELRARAGWDQRYWLARPRTLPPGSRVQLMPRRGDRESVEGKPWLWVELASRRRE